MTECARAGLGQSCCTETGLRNPFLANGLCFPHVRGLRGLSFLWVPCPSFALKGAVKGKLEHKPTGRAVEGCFIAT